MRSGIYKITNPEGKVYIGCTKDLERREHNYKLKKCFSQKLIYESILFYGWGKHKFEVIEITEDLILREKYWIKKLDTYNEGLNGNKGGGGPTIHSKTTRLKISKMGSLNKGKRSISHRKGKKLNKEHKLNISMGRKGIPSHRKGKKLSEEHKLNISKGKKGVPNPNNAKVILQYDKDNNFIAEHPSIEQAAISVNGNPTAINNALRKGGEATSSSYIWKYKKL